ncbi:hypothetical protein CHK_3009 [Christensenella hongkongensis]|uniref:Uncharacterized protein n=1 Tax=Christensenella hongkongensis TaxID=270498 RepID=A0A0M2NEN2_9FIRM|nr:hypothetical protein CHK_3009 [Christensenella hongkongensis]
MKSCKKVNVANWYAFWAITFVSYCLKWNDEEYLDIFVCTKMYDNQKT